MNTSLYAFIAIAYWDVCLLSSHQVIYIIMLIYFYIFFMSLGWDVKWCPVSKITQSRLLRAARKTSKFHWSRLLIAHTALNPIQSIIYKCVYMFLWFFIIILGVGVFYILNSNRWVNWIIYSVYRKKIIKNRLSMLHIIKHRLRVQ